MAHAVGFQEEVRALYAGLLNPIMKPLRTALVSAACVAACATASPEDDLIPELASAPPAGGMVLGEFLGSIGADGSLVFTPLVRDEHGRLRLAATTGSITSKPDAGTYVRARTVQLVNDDASECGVAGVTCAIVALENNWTSRGIGNAHTEIVTLTPAGNEFDPAISASSRQFLAGMRGDLGLVDYGSLAPPGTAGGSDVARRFWRFKTVLPSNFRFVARVVGIPFAAAGAQGWWRADTCASACCLESGCPATGLGASAGDALPNLVASSAYAQLTDQTGAGRHLAQATASARPTRVANALAGYKPVARFDGTDDTLANTSSGVGTAANATLALVVSPRTTSGGSPRGFFSATSSGGVDETAGLVVHSGTGNTTAFDTVFVAGAKGASGDLFTPTAALGSMHVVTLRYQTDTVAMTVDGADAGTATGAAAAPAFDVLRLAARSGPAAANYLNMDFAEALLMTGVVPNEQLADVVSYLSEKYQALPGQSESGSNDSCATANTFTVPGRVAGAINPAGEVDYYKFTTTAYADLHIETFDTNGPYSCAAIDPQIQLLSSSCTALAPAKDDDGTALCSAYDSGVDGALKRVPPGTYVVRVERSTSLFAGGASTFGYTLQVSFNALCGNNIREGSEECDRGATGDATCTSSCTLAAAVCGDGVLTGAETCDDGNAVGGDGCSATCQLEAGWGCGTRIGCVPICGDGVLVGTEACDDGNRTVGDGCDSACKVEAVISEAGTNDSKAQADANAIRITAASTTIAGTLNPNSDVDWYRMDLAAAGTVRVETFNGEGANAGLGCSISTSVSLRDAAGDAIAVPFSNPATTLTDSSDGMNGCSSVATTLAAGTYYVRVARNGGTNRPAYRLQVKVQTNLGNEVESNATMALATPLRGSDVVVLGDHTTATDDDFFAIYVPQGRGVRAEIIEGDPSTRACARSGSNGDTEQDSLLTMYDASGTQVAQDDDSGREPCSLLNGVGSTPKTAGAGNLSAGVYYLRVAGWQPGGSYAPRARFKYRLLVSIR